MTIDRAGIVARLVTVLLLGLVFAGGAAARVPEWRVTTHATVVSPVLSGSRVVWAEQVGTNGFRILTVRLGARARVVASIPNRRVHLGPQGDDQAFLKLATWPGGIAYAYEHEYCFEDCVTSADHEANKPSSTMRIAVVPFGRPARVLWRKSCPQLAAPPEVAIAGRTLATIRGSCDGPATVETSDLLGARRRRLSGFASADSLQASGRFISVAQRSKTLVIDLRTRKTVLSLPRHGGPVSLASDGAIVFATIASGSAPWQIAWASPRQPVVHQLLSDVTASWPLLFPARGLIAVVRTQPDDQPPSVEILSRSGRQLAELPSVAAGRFGADVFGFDGHNVAWVMRGYVNRNRPDTIVVRCVLDCN